MNRLLKSYHRELEDYKKQPKAYKTSGIWTGTEYRYICGNRINDSKLEEKLKNFPQNEMGIGISIRHNYTIEDIKYLITLWKAFTKLPIKVLEYPDTFGFNGFYLDNIFSIGQAMRLSHSAKMVSDLTEGNVVEIGGGFGGTPYHLFKDFDFRGTYFNFDIPYVGLIEKYFLMNVFPKKKFLLYGEDDIKNFADYDMVLMPHYMIKDLPKDSCDVVFNANSLPEMGRKQIKEYLKQIDRISTKYFLHINHQYQSWTPGYLYLQDIDENDVANFSRRKWELPMNRWNRVSMKLNMFSSCFSDNPKEDYSEYFEYLYKKI